MKYVVMFSSGAGSWAAAKRVVAWHGTDSVVLLFADTLIEDEDNYRFLREAAASLGVPVTTVADGRTPWQVFKDVRLIGNTRADPCSRVLKRELLRKWLEDNCDPEQTVVYLGFDWQEEHRANRAARHWLPWHVECPMADPPYRSRLDVLDDMRDAGIDPPRLYAMGFPHANCGGFCVKAGHAWFKLLLAQMPERYAHHEAQEQAMRDYLGKDVAILRDRRGKTTKPLTMKALRERVEAGGTIDEFDWGGCACFEDGEQ